MFILNKYYILVGNKNKSYKIYYYLKFTDVYFIVYNIFYTLMKYFFKKNVCITFSGLIWKRHSIVQYFYTLLTEITNEVKKKKKIYAFQFQ